MIRSILILFSLIFIVRCSNDVSEVVPINRDKEAIGIINDQVGGSPVVIYANAINRTFIAFKSQTNTSNENLKFVTSDSGYPIILKDQYQREYDISGIQVGSDDKIYLKPIDQVVGYWFFFPAFFHKLYMYDGQSLVNSNYQTDIGDWLINTDFVFSGSFRDGIPSIDNPSYDRLEGKALIENEFYSNLDEDELVIVIKSGNQNYVYPHRILEYHEVLNDNINGLPIVISYCPLTGTSKVWNRNIMDKVVEFGVSGLLYNNNLILYDRSSETLWSQILSIGVNGDYISEVPSNITLIETSLSSVGLLQGEKYYLSIKTGFNFDYSKSLYDNYKTDSRVSFPLTFRSDLLHPKERVLGISYEEEVKIYRFVDFLND